MLQMFLKKVCGVVVAPDGFRQDDVHMEHMGHFFVGKGAVALPRGFDAFVRKMLIHGLGVVPEEIVAGGGDESRGIISSGFLQSAFFLKQ